MKKIRKASLLIAACICIMSFASCGSKVEVTVPNEFAGCDIFASEELSLKCVDDSVIDAEFIKGHELTVLNFWTTYCNPCIGEMPVLEKLAAEDPDSVAIVGLVCDVFNTDGTINDAQLELAKSIMEKTGVTYPVILADEKMQEDLLPLIMAVPTTLFIDSSGKVIGTAVGSMNETGWRDAISEYKVAK